MMNERLKQIAFAEGHVESFIENSVGAAEPDSVDQANRLLAMWKTVSDGLRELRTENAILQECLDTARKALN